MIFNVPVKLRNLRNVHVYVRTVIIIKTVTRVVSESLALCMLTVFQSQRIKSHSSSCCYSFIDILFILH